MSFLSLCNLFSQNDSELVLIKEIETFSFNTLQLISLYIISSVIAHKDDPRFLVFVFDNIDEMDRQYLNNSLKDMIVSAFSVAQDYCENVLRFDFIKKTTVLISFRIENDSFLIGNTVNERYLLLHFQKIDFSHEYQAAYNEILAARIQCYLRANGKEVDLKEKHDEIRALIESEHFFFEQSIKPLYSYDYRMLTHYVIKEALCNRKVYIPDALKQSQGKTKYAQVGSRGMLLFYALAGMLRDGNSCFSTYVKEDFSDTGCNVYRMSFTLLSNICGWSHQKGGLYEGVIDYNEKTCLVHLSTFIERITPWCSDRHDDAVNKLLKLGLTACSFERPIALLGDEIDRYNNELKENYSMSTFAPNATHNHLKDLSALSTVSIQVNPLCFVYAARVFIHYEYFNLISTQWHNKENSKRGMLYDSKPLFQLSSSEQDMKNIELCLDYTFQTAKHIIISADNHFCAGCNKRNNGQQCQSDCRSFVNKFIDDGLSFNNTLDATRIIVNHIHYLESYRRFLWFQNANIEHTEVDVQIQRIIINQILKYISFYRQRKIMDREYHRISNDWGIQYKNALAILDNHPQEFTEIDGGL